jgi:transcriptional regulator with XRE-family HTH domain
MNAGKRMTAQDYFSRRLRDLTSRRRRDPRPTKQDIARALDVQPGTITNWLTGLRRISLDDAERVADYLGLPIGQLVDENSVEMTPDEIHFLYFIRGLRLDSPQLERLKRSIGALYESQSPAVAVVSSRVATQPASRKRRTS